jgi:multiple sugar transport system permease protein
MKLRYPWVERSALIAAFAVVAVFAVLPFAMTIYYGFSDLSFNLPGRSGRIIGFGNYSRLVNDSRFFTSCGVTLKLAAMAIPVELILGLVVALALSRMSGLRKLLLPSLSLPLFLSGVSVGLIWRLLLNGDFGIVPYALRKLGLLSVSVSILGSSGGALLSLLIVDVWQWSPFFVLVLLASRLSLPDGPYFAGSLDGAPPWRLFWDITLPGLQRAILVCIVFRLMDVLREFDKVVTLTNGGPGAATETLSLYLWNVSYLQGDLGYGSAVSVLVWLVVLLVFNGIIAISRKPGVDR